MIILRHFRPLSLLLVFLACAASSGEVLMFQDFENFDLKALPAGWSVVKAEDLSIVEEAGHGKVLKIATQGNGWPSLKVDIDAGKIRGHQIRISASCKFAGNYTPIQDKLWARPKFQLTYKDKAGKDYYIGSAPEPNKPGWQDLFEAGKIEADAEGAGAFLRIDLVAAEVLFDDFVVEIDPDMSQPPPKSKPNTAAAATPATGTTPATPAATTPDALAKKAPKKTFEDGGLTFSPEIAAALQKVLKGDVNKNTILFAGPGLPHKECEAKIPEKWTRVTAGNQFAGALATPRNLLANLPEFLAKNKPEVVVLFGEMTAGRKPTSTERYDWEDLARICLRSGAIPVIAIPPVLPGQDAVENQNVAMTMAAGEALCPAIDLKAPQVAPRRLGAVVELLETYVFCRISPEAVANKPKKPEEE